MGLGNPDIVSICALGLPVKTTSVSVSKHFVLVSVSLSVTSDFRCRIM